MTGNDTAEERDARPRKRYLDCGARLSEWSAAADAEPPFRVLSSIGLQELVVMVGRAACSCLLGHADFDVEEPDSRRASCLVVIRL